MTIPVNVVSSEKTILPETVIRALYSQTLYGNFQALSLSSPKIIETEIVPFLGNNNKNILLIVRFEQETYLPERHLSFIAKMLGACKLNIGDVAIINDKKRNLDIDLLYFHFQPRHIILFGIDPGELNIAISMPLYVIKAYKKCNFLFTPSLDALNQETDESTSGKKKLWGSLKQIFEV